MANKNNILKNKKIMWVVGFTPEKIGSYEELMFYMAKQAIDKGFEISFVFPAGPIKKFEEKILQLRAYVFIAPLRKRIDIKAIKYLASLITKEKPTILHSNFDLGNFNSYFATLCAKVPIYIWHQHNFMGERLSLIRRLFLGLLSWRVDKIVVLSGSMKKDLISKGVRENKISIVYNGISVEKFSPLGLEGNVNLKKEFGISSDTIALTSVADSRPEKGLIFLIRAFSRVANKYPQCILLLVGSKKGPCYNELKEEGEKLGIAEKIFFTEFRNDVPDILHISDIVIVPPTMEVSLYSIMEAMASFKPVIASRVGGIPEVVKNKETGILVTPRDAEALSNVIDYLISNPLVREKIGKAGRLIVEEKFSIKRNVEQLLMLYEQILQAKDLT